MTLNGVIAIVCINSPEAVAFAANYVKLTVARSILFTDNYSPRTIAFSNSLLWFIYGDVRSIYL